MLTTSLLLASLSLAGDDASAPLSFSEAVSQLSSGASLRAVIRYGQCLRNSEPGPQVTAGVPLQRFEYAPKGALGNPSGFLAASHTQWVLHPRHGYALEQIRLLVYEDLRVEVSKRLLEPRKVRVLGEEIYGCSLGPNGGLTLHD
ncbi:MAG: hypothetical protein KTR31_13105 [Myxococcales bacterium]|nr:hypothetical protein [Myxococcales bacterium]